MTSGLATGVLRLLRALRRRDVASQAAASPAEARLDRLVREADALRDRGDAARAAAAYRDIIALAPDRVDLRVQQGNMLKDSGALAEAEAVYRDALALADRADTHLQIGHVLKAKGDRDGALGEYRRALALDPHLIAAIEELAEAGDPAAARRRFETVANGGGIEALLALSDTVARMRDDLDRLARLLPEVRSRTAFPIALYGTYRDLFPVPPAPNAPACRAHILLLAERETVATLFAQVAAITAQTWRGYSLSVLGQTSERRRVVELAAAADPRIRWIDVAGRTETAAAEDEAAGALAQAAGPDDWLLLLAPGAMLDPEALGWFAAAFSWNPAAGFVCDEERGTESAGRIVRADPVLRQRPDFDSLLDANPFGETVAIRAAAYRAARDGLPKGSVTAARGALLLGLASAGQIGHIPLPLLWRADPSPADAADHRRGVAHQIAAMGLADRIEFRPEGAFWRPPDVDEPLAVAICTRDNAADLARMVSSLRATAAVPSALEIIVVDNGTTEPEDLARIAALEAEDVRVLRRPGAFNWSQLNRDAAAEARAPIVVFANDDMRMLSRNWDARLRGLLARPEVGAVGARLLYPDGTVQHAGVLLGWKGSVIHDGLHAAGDDPGPADRWRLTRAAGAVTGAFLAIRRERFFEMGGFDAASLPVAYSDIDLCLKLRSAGFKVLWTPAMTLEHHETKSRGPDHQDPWRRDRNARERALMETRWGPALDTDPFVNPCWVDATLPFRLIAAPSVERVKTQVEQCSASSARVLSARKGICQAQHS